MTFKGKTVLLLLLEGLASSGLQMITLRQTVEFVGSSILTTSVIISSFLGALALGYYWGGQQKPENYNKALINNLIYSIALFGIGMSYIFVQFFFVSFADISSGIPILSNPLVHLAVFCLLIMSPLVFFLSQTVPLLINTAKEESRKSEASGNATAISTIGNVIGCLITSLVLMYYLGVSYSIFINCFILAICLAFVVDWREPKTKGLIMMTTVGLAVIFSLNVRFTNNLFAATTPYSNIQIAEHPEGRRLVINRSNASFINEQTREGWPYIETIKNGIFSEDLQDKNVLVLGAGGFTLSAEATHGANFTYIDVDPMLKPIAEEAFLKENINGKFIVSDARVFLLTNDKKWDVIVVDLYTNSATIPMHTATLEFFTLVSSKLKDSGKAVLNIVANPTLKDNYSLNMDNTIRHALSRCITDVTDYQDKMVNIIYFCSKNSGDTVASLYIDDTTKVTVDGYIASMKLEKWVDSKKF